MKNNNSTLPPATDAEKGLLWSMLHAPERVIPEFIDSGQEGYFHHPAHREIYRHILKMWTEQMAVDFITLTQFMRDRGALDRVGGDTYITEVAAFTTATGMAPEYARILRDKWERRETIALARALDAAARDQACELGDGVQEAFGNFHGMFETKAKTQTMPALVAAALERYEAANRGEGGITGLSTGIPPFDKVTRGLKPGEMITISAQTKDGKSALAVNIMAHNALAGIPVGIFSLEMSADEVTDRLFSGEATIDLTRLSDGGFSAAEMDRISETGLRLSAAPIFIRNEAVLAPLQFRAAARKLVAQNKCKLLIVDYLQLMEPTNTRDNRERQVAECSRTMKTTASELGVPILVLCQLNEDNRARESKAIEQDSNIFAIIEPAQSGNGQDYDLNLKYTRSCPRARIPLTFRKEFLRFEDRNATGHRKQIIILMSATRPKRREDIKGELAERIHMPSQTFDTLWAELKEFEEIKEDGDKGWLLTPAALGPQG